MRIWDSEKLTERVIKCPCISSNIGFPQPVISVNPETALQLVPSMSGFLVRPDATYNEVEEVMYRLTSGLYRYHISRV